VVFEGNTYPASPVLYLCIRVPPPAMALTSWKTFNFFTKSEVPVPADEDGNYPFDVSGSRDMPVPHFLTVVVLQSDLASIASGADSLFLGSSNGYVRVLSRAFKVVRSFRAANSTAASITYLTQIPNTSLLVTIAEDLSSDPVLKVWALDKAEKKTGGPKCLCTVAVQNGRRQFPV